MTDEFQELAIRSTETFINLQDHEIYDITKMYYYFKLMQSISGQAAMLTHFQMSCGALLVKVCKKTPESTLTALVSDSNQLRDFIQHELTRVIEFIKENGTEKDFEEYL